MIIKLLLLAGLLLAAVLAYRSPLNSRNAALRRLFTLVLLGAGAVAVFSPRLVTVFARELGVGRGTDLLVYFLAVVSLLAWLSLWRRIYELEQRLVLLTRRTALHDAQHRLSGTHSVPDGDRQA
jgi:small membrane protein